MRGNSRRNSNNKKLLIGSGVLAVGLLSLFLVPFLIGTAASVVMVPVTYVQHWIAESGSSIPSYIRDRNALIEENKSLAEELSILKSTDGLEEVVERESEILAGLAKTGEDDQILASLISRPGFFPYDVFLIDKGTSDGVQVGAPVYAGEWQAIGFIAKAYPGTSLVVLATSPGYESVVYIYGPDIYTTAVGQGGGILEVSVPQGIPLNEEDPVIIPALHSGLYGTVSHVESVPTEPEQRGYLSIDIPLNTIRFVTVGKDPLAELSFDEAREVVKQVRQDMLSVPVPEGILVETATTSTSTEGVSTTTDQSNDDGDNTEN